MSEEQSVVSVSQMAKMVGLSRQRFHQLATEGVFMTPIYDIVTRRPYYNQPMQDINLQVRKKNFGLNNRPILFYARRIPSEIISVEPCKRRSIAKSSTKEHQDLIDGLKGLGLNGITEGEVSTALKILYPKGVPNDASEILRSVFVKLMTGPRI